MSTSKRSQGKREEKNPGKKILDGMSESLKGAKDYISDKVPSNPFSSDKKPTKRKAKT